MSALYRLVGCLLARLYQPYFATLRIRIKLPDGSIVDPHGVRFDREIFAVCERDLFALVGLKLASTALVAHGRDGDWAAAAGETIGYRVVRGSTKSGGAQALRQLIAELRAPTRASGLVVVDGPLGPPGEAKPGIVYCAVKTGRPIRALGVAARHAIVFKGSWSRIYLPLPFSRVAVVASAPMTHPADTARRQIDLGAAELTGALDETHGAALQMIGRRRARGEPGLPARDAADHP